MSRIRMGISLLGAFGVPIQDSKRSVSVFRITTNAVEEHRFEKYPRALELMIANGRPHTGELLWTGHEFVPDRLRAFPREFPMGPVDTFSNVGGWSKRSFVSQEEGARPFVTELTLGGHSKRLVTSTRDWVVTIDLDRQDGSAAQHLVSIDTRPRGVSADEYVALLSTVDPALLPTHRRVTPGCIEGRGE